MEGRRCSKILWMKMDRYGSSWAYRKYWSRISQVTRYMESSKFRQKPRILRSMSLVSETSYTPSFHSNPNTILIASEVRLSMLLHDYASLLLHATEPYYRFGLALSERTKKLVKHQLHNTKRSLDGECSTTHTRHS